MINQTPTQSASDNDAPPVACKQIRSEDGSDEEVPSTFPIVHPSNMLDFEEDDKGDETFEDAVASSSDEEDVSLAAIAKKSKDRSKGTKNKTTSKGGKTVRRSFSLCSVFIIWLLHLLLKTYD